MTTYSKGVQISVYLSHPVGVLLAKALEREPGFLQSNGVFREAPSRSRLVDKALGIGLSVLLGHGSYAQNENVDMETDEPFDPLRSPRPIVMPSRGRRSAELVARDEWSRQTSEVARLEGYLSDRLAEANAPGCTATPLMQAKIARLARDVSLAKEREARAKAAYEEIAGIKPAAAKVAPEEIGGPDPWPNDDRGERPDSP